MLARQQCGITDVVSAECTRVLEDRNLPQQSQPHRPTPHPTVTTHSLIHEAQPSLTNHPTIVHADVKTSPTQNATKYSFPCCAVKSCPLVNDCDLLAGFSDFYLPLTQLMPSLPSSYRVYICYGKTRMTGLQSSEVRLIINPVV